MTVISDAATQTMMEDIQCRLRERDELLKALRNLLTWAQNQIGLPDIALPMLHDDNPLRTAAELIKRAEEQ